MAAMKDVAQRAGVSIATVSRVLNDRQGDIPISEATSQRVLDAVVALNYKPHYAARRLRAKELEHSVGIYIPWGWGLVGFSGFVGTLIESISTYLKERPFSITLIFYEPGTISEHYEELDRVRSHRIDGMIVAGANQRDLAFLDRLPADATLPVVLVQRELARGSYVTPDNRGGVRLAVSHLIEHGHRRVAFVSRALENDGLSEYAYMERYRGYLDALEEHDLPVDETLVRLDCNSERRDAPRVVGELLALGNAPTALFASRDAVAAAACRAAKVNGRRVPDDLAVIGVADSMHVAGFFDPRLTCLLLPIERVGRRAVDHLVHLIDAGGHLPLLQERIQCHLVVGESCGCAPDLADQSW